MKMQSTDSIQETLLRLATVETRPFLEDTRAERDLKQLCQYGLLNVLVKMGIENKPLEGIRSSLGIAEKLDRFWAELFSELLADGILEVNADRLHIPFHVMELLRNFDFERDSELLIRSNASYIPYVKQLRLCLSCYVDLLKGIIPATDVIFPNGDLENVSGIYKNNYRANYFNDILGELVAGSVANSVGSLNPGDKIRILEIGGGTGGTSEGLFKRLAPFSANLEYTFSDVSRSFLFYADRYMEVAPYIKTALFNIEEPASNQKIPAGFFDIIVGANVVHATRNINKTLQNLKSVMKKGGLMILNEIAQTEFFYTVTFGLLDGWWLYEDEHLRLKGCPGLSSESWKIVLDQTGFTSASFYPRGLQLPQQIIAAVSDGKGGKVQLPPSILPHLEHSSTEVDLSIKSIDLDWLKDKLLTIAAETIKLPKEEFNIDERFSDYGFDSILGTTLIKNMNDDLGINLKTIDIFNYPDITSMAEYIKVQFAETIQIPVASPKSESRGSTILTGEVTENLGGNSNRTISSPENSKIEPAKVLGESIDHRGEQVAIIGMSGKFGAAESLEVFWETIREGRSLIEEVPANRWDKNVHYSASKNEPGKTNSKWGSFLRDTDKFDPLFFKISGREAEVMDPQQRLFMEECWKALEDAGINPQKLKSSKTGVFVGAGPSDYLDGEDSKEAASFWGNASSILASRISYFLDLKGPAVSLDTACSSSLVALDLGCKSLLTNETDLILTGGVWLATRPDFYKQTSKAGMLSPDGQCYTFDSRANGFVPGEGVGVVILKRLSDAERDGDRIYGIIKGSLTNQDGATNGITAPSSLAQQALETEVYTKFNIDPHTIGCVEAHGTGTSLGDPIEFEALSASFQKFTGDKGFCSLGSVKTNIGHTVMASGVAGIIKVLLCFKHRLLVPSLNYVQQNPLISVPDSPFKIQQKSETWLPSGNFPRRATVSSFGFSGTNAHVVLEEYISKNREKYTSTEPAIFVLSARDKDCLKTQVKNLLFYTKQYEGIDLYAMAYTLQVGREPMEQRLSFTAKHMVDLQENLQAYCNAESGRYYEGDGLVQKEQFFLQGAPGTSTVEAAIQAKDSETLAQLWAKGMTIDWVDLYSEKRPEKISLPTYPFLRDRYWIAQDNQMGRSEQKMLHPLVQENISTFAKQSYRTVLTGEEVFVKDHKLFGQTVFPGVAYLEMARHATSISSGQEIKQLRNVSWVNPLHFDQGIKELAIKTELGRKGIIFEVTNWNGDSNLYCRGEANYETLPQIDSIDINALQRSFSYGSNRLESYEQFKAMGLTYGPGFQGIHTLYNGLNVALASIELVPNPGFMLDPSIMDSAVQTCLSVMLREDKNRTVVPFRVKEVNIYADLPNRIWSYARKSGTNMDGVKNSLLTYDIDLFDMQGRVLVQLKAFSFSPMNPEAKRPEAIEFSHPALHLFGNHWNEREPGRGIVNSDLTTPTILLAGGSARLADALSQETKMPVESISCQTAEDLFFTVLQKIKSGMEQRVPLHFIVLVQNHEFAEYGYITGLLKTANQENASISGRVVGVERLISNEQKWLASILTFEKDKIESEVRYINGKRQVKSLDPMISISSVPLSVAIKEGGVYLIAGGMGGLGQIFERHIHKVTGTRVILTGRRDGAVLPLNLMNNGSEREYRSCDLSSRADVDRLLNEIIAKYGRIDGIIHSAGVLRDNLLHKDTPWSDIQEVLEPKIQGVKNLDLASQEFDLDFMVYFSSVAGVIGNSGQAAYAAANAYLDHYAQFRNELVEDGRRKGKTLSINWPYWKAGGMQMDLEHQRYLKNVFGLKPMSEAVGLAAFEQILRSANGQVVVGYGEGDKIFKSFSERQVIMLLAKTKVKQAIHNGGASESGAVNSDLIPELVRIQIQQIASEILKFDQKTIRVDKDLMGYGFDSNMLARFANDLNDYYGIDLAPTAFYNYSTINELVSHLTENYSQELHQKYREESQQEGLTSVSESSVIGNKGEELPNFPSMKSHHSYEDFTPYQASNEPVAIVGISGRFPGSEDLATFWEQIRDKKDLVTEIPEERWDWREYYGDPRKDLYKTKAKWGGFISDMDKFDPLFFEISPVEAELMDPQQRITLEAVYSALEDASIPAAKLRGSNTGVFIGVLNNDYTMLLGQQKDLIIQAQISSGNLRTILANRVSYLLDLHGPSEPIDTACSSSLVAVHRAVENIRSGRCKVAIAGGVNAILSPETTISISNAGMLSEDGRCKTFDQSANGYVRAEGVGIVILKSLSEAERDGDRIYGIIRGTAENHGGKANTLTSPNPQAQKELLLSAYRSANVDPSRVSYIEAHGTGTSMGDPIETEGLKMAFATLYKEKGLSIPSEPICGIGSVKTNIGHLESAAGMAGIIKVLLSLKYQMIPGNPQLNTPNEFLRLSGSPFYLQKDTTPWFSPMGMPRIAGVSGFGFGGANAHIIIEEYLGGSKKRFESTEPSVLLLSAKNTERLKAKVKDLLTHIQVNPLTDLNDMAYTLQVGRDPMRERLSIIAKNIPELQGYLSDFLGGKSDGMYRGSIVSNELLSDLEEEQLRSQAQKALSGKDYHSLASLWVKGADIAWSKLYGDIKPVKIALPTYPFARKRYWIPQSKQVINPSGNLTIHPLVHRNSSTLKSHKYSSLFSGKESFIKDHKVGGKCLMPGVAYIEMISQAGSMSTQKRVTQLNNVSWHNAFHLTGDTQEIEIKIEQSRQDFGFNVSTFGQESNLSLCSGSFSTFPLVEVAAIDLEAIKSRLSDVTAGDDCYTIFREAGLEYGSSFQGISTLFMGDSESLAFIELPVDARYSLNPGLIDSALQTCLGTIMTSTGLPSALVPFAVRQVNLYQAPTDRIWAYAIKKSKVVGQNEIISFDIEITDDSGQVHLQFKDLSVLSLSGEPVLQPKKSGLAHAESLHLFDYSWQETLDVTLGYQSGLIPAQIILLEEKNSELASALGDILNLPVKSLSDSEVADLFNGLLDILKENITKQRSGPILLFYNSAQVLRYGFLSGLLRTLQLENERLTPRMIGVEMLRMESPLAMAALIKSELEIPFTKTEMEIRYVEGRRQSKRLQIFSTEQSSVAAMAQEQGVYLITGGVGALGYLFAHYLTKTKDVQVVITGRRPASEVKNFENINYLQCDVSDADAVRALIQEITVRFGKLNGILHSAGVTRDSFIMNKTSKEVREVFAPKVKGVQNLDQAIGDTPLDFFILFSSLAAVKGNIGQADYAAANAYLDQFAHERNKRVANGVSKGRTLSINWPLWAEGGMSVNEGSAHYLEKKWGMMPMPSQEGIKAFEKLLGSSLSQGVVMYGQKEKLIDEPLNKINRGSKIQLQAADRTLFQTILEKDILKLIAQVLTYDVEDLMPDVELSSYGFDSIILTKFTNQFNDYYELDLSPAEFFTYSTIRELAGFMIDHYLDEIGPKYSHLISNLTSEVAEESRILPNGPTGRYPNSKSNPSTKDDDEKDPVAIVGMSGRFPGSENLVEFWEQLTGNKDLIREIPPDRWDWKSYYGDSRRDALKTKAKWGGFISDIDKFDASFFEISAREAELMDPQHRITLEAVFSALEDAGIPTSKLKGTSVSVFIGVLNNDYADLLSEQRELRVHAHYATGNTHSMLANRISYLLDIHGPSEPIDTACSSSLIALNRAVDSIQSGRCAMAIAGGVNSLLSVDTTLAVSNAGMLSEDGRCRTFDQRANGYVRAEGVGILVLKSLSQAQKDGDHIYALIRGTAENHGGRANTLTSPNPIAQKEVILNAYRRAGVDPRTISYIEAHGTGTALGDPIEAEGLKMAFETLFNEWGLSTPSHPVCSIGSVKTNIGHLESAAGVAGVIKVLLSMKHRILPGNPQLENANEFLRLNGSSFTLQKKTTPWISPENTPRRAGVSSFGFGGTNAHIVLEEYIPSVPADLSQQEQVIILLSAKNKDRLRKRVEDLHAYLVLNPEVSIHQVAYTLQVGRDHLSQRMGFVTVSVIELQEKLKNFLKDDAVFCEGHTDEGNGPVKLLDSDKGNRLLDLGQYEQLLELWCLGGVVDWKRLYPLGSPGKISLPTYPFARERHWILPSPEKKSHSQIVAIPVAIREENSETYGMGLPLSRIGEPDFLDLLKDRLAIIAAETVKKMKSDIDIEKDFFENGFDSLSGVELIRNINAVLPITLDFADLFSNPTISTLSDYIYAQLSTGISYGPQVLTNSIHK
ncbi:SDR family NAD(P)-dependent oxidoreductase [Dyadobacter tibetensis]|uniref:SDR family NAD(P)-dependent oxidoreductase n=1 Tax=Dyadobacter tibetensis TaxID=1211851 RepID=UPI00046F5457|nr:SDR family NAD(P)-dependent oxidoreductase [Dyadobacter tibetensis]